MKACEVARRLGLREFLMICSWLDAVYGKEARRFEVLSVERWPNKTLKAMRVMLMNNTVIDITPEQIKKDYERKMRERKSTRASSSDTA